MRDMRTLASLYLHRRNAARDVNCEEMPTSSCIMTWQINHIILCNHEFCFNVAIKNLKHVLQNNISIVTNNYAYCQPHLVTFIINCMIGLAKDYYVKL